MNHRGMGDSTSVAFPLDISLPFGSEFVHVIFVHTLLLSYPPSRKNEHLLCGSLQRHVRWDGPVGNKRGRYNHHMKGRGHDPGIPPHPRQLPLRRPLCLHRLLSASTPCFFQQLVILFCRVVVVFFFFFFTGGIVEHILIQIDSNSIVKIQFAVV